MGSRLQIKFSELENIASAIFSKLSNKIRKITHDFLKMYNKKLSQMCKMVENIPTF